MGHSGVRVEGAAASRASVSTERFGHQTMPNGCVSMASCSAQAVYQERDHRWVLTGSVQWRSSAVVDAVPLMLTFVECSAQES